MIRHPGMATAENSVLVVIDPQRKLVDMINDRELVMKTMVQLLEFAPVFGIPVISTEHYPQGLGYTVEEVKEALADYRPIQKRIFSCFGVPEFGEALQMTGRRNLLVCGIETHICVSQTVLDALHRGYAVQVAADAVGARRPLDHEIAIERLRQSGAVITTAEAAMYEIAARADTEEFKRLLALVK